MKQTVIEFIPSLNDGGAETLVKDYSLLMNKNLYNVVIIVIRELPHSANSRILEKNGAKIIPIYKHWNIYTRLLNRVFREFFVPLRLKYIIRNEHPQAFHIHLRLLEYVKKISKDLYGIKLFYTCHNLPSIFFSGKNTKEFEAAKYLIEHNKLQMIALHQNMAKEINQLFKISDTIVIRNGIDFRRFQNVQEKKKNIRKSLNIPEKAFVVGHVGRFCKQKNHYFLIEVFKELLLKKKDSFLLLVGDGEMKEEVIRLIDNYNLLEKVIILSNRIDIPRLMKAMDIFLLPSLYEGLGIVAIEAQVSRLRCLMSNTIPSDAFMTEDAIPISIKNPFEWVNVILDESIKSKPCGLLSDWDMNNEIRRIERLYSGDNSDV